MVAPGRRYGRLRGSGLSDATALARCGPCGARASNQMLRRAISTAKRTVTRGGNKRPLTRETRLENGPSLARSGGRFFRGAFACVHVSGLLVQRWLLAKMVSAAGDPNNPAT